MKFDFMDVKVQNVDLTFIKSKIIDIEIFKFYCHNFKDLNKGFKSEFYADNNPSCYIKWVGFKLYYKDFGTGEQMDCYNYVQKKFHCNLNEACQIISNDFSLITRPYLINKEEYINKEIMSQKSKESIIKVYNRPWRLQDYQYWIKYGISLDLLTHFSVNPCKFVIVKGMRIDDKPKDPVYCYNFDDKVKIYRPLCLDRYKFLNNVKEGYLQGYNELPWIDDLLIITSSFKDVLSLKSLGFNSIAPQSETSDLSEELINKLLKRFKNLVLLYDNDLTGLNYSEKWYNKYQIPYFFMQEAKDVSDNIAKVGSEETKKYILNKLNDINSKN